ncbi:hypothetical protein CFP65_1820 [Kitasatospora sp. MMS16-BH015]|uniref:DUF4232 domain-containing protein n=1 Tax=Kitasatospora sp. MMS16-BH015 TaxID=2018025 RepID=UPI000CA219EB|nr:DUF4232 domain-containing protein [Kitasatospora sp. MMS16-BH015]AUG76694.1 hypothetical protein CFP65_1820 [Kitasatospora sp. MMS16-BH015]
MRVQRALAAGAVLVVTGLALTACQDDKPADGGAAVSAPSSAAAAAGAPAAAGSAAPGSTGGSAGGSAGTTGSAGKTAVTASPVKAQGDGTTPAKIPGTAACTTDSLVISNSVGNATPPLPDLVSVTVSFYNKSQQACVLNGFPGIDLAISEGSTSVPRGRGQAAPVTLAFNQFAQATVWYRPAPKGHNGDPVTTMTITPPGETHSFKIAWPGTSLAAGNDARGTDTLFVEPVVRH